MSSTSDEQWDELTERSRELLGRAFSEPGGFYKRMSVDPQREVSEDCLCPRCGDIATKHIWPGFLSEIRCSTCLEES